MEVLEQLLRETVKRGASDLHITVGVPPIMRINGHLKKVGGDILLPAETRAMFESIAQPRHVEKFDEVGEVDFAYGIPSISRFRINAFRQRASVAIAARVINENIPTLESLGHPPILKQLSRRPRGLILITGPTGSGKSTTMAAMINLLNVERSAHVITLEDPIEYLHKHGQSIVNQREIGADSRSFANALRAALREDPDVIMVGEMRDVETIGIAITAAETGHLVLATMHTQDTAQTIDRIIDVFPPFQQNQIRIQLSLTLQGVVCQQLLPKQDNSGRVAALEIMITTPAIRNLIREGKTHQLNSTLQTGGQHSMQTMDMSLRDLVKRNVISTQEAVLRASDPDNLRRLLG